MITCGNGAFFLCAFFAFGAGEAAVFGAGRQSVQAAEPAYMNKEVPLGDAR